MCVSVFAVGSSLWTLMLAVEDSVNSCLFIFSALFHPSCQPDSRGQGGVAACVWQCVPTQFKCASLCQSVSMRWSQDSRARGEETFFPLPNSTLGWLMCWCVHGACSGSAPRCRLWKMFHMSALPKPSGLCVDSMSCSSEMIFIPLGILDKFAWSPLTKHVLGRVSPNLSWDCSIFYQNNCETADFGLILEACVTAVPFSIHASRMPFGTALWSRCCWERQQKSEQLGLFSSFSPTSSLFCLSLVFLSFPFAHCL